MKLLLIIQLFVFTTCGAIDGPDLQGTFCNLPEHVLFSTQNYKCNFTLLDSKGHLSSIKFTFVTTECQDTFDLGFVTQPKDDVTSAEIVLLTKKELDYDVKQEYSCTLKMTNDAGLSNDGYIYVDVIRKPIWTNIPSIKEIKEKEEIVKFNVSAEVTNHPEVSVEYYLVNDDGAYLSSVLRRQFDFEYWINISVESGLITISSIDRDVGINNFTIDLLAWVQHPLTSNTDGHILVLVNDIDDHNAKIQPMQSNYIYVQQNATEVSIYINANDADQGPNAVYLPVLKTPQEVKDAFSVSPQIGEGNTEFSIDINPEKLDFDDPKFENFTIEFTTIGVKNNSHVDSLTMSLHLAKYKSAGGIITSTFWLVLLSIFVRF